MGNPNMLIKKGQMLSAMKMLMALILGAALTACQSVPAKKGFSAQQIAVLQEQGFQPTADLMDDDWFLSMPSRLLFPSDASELEPEKLEDIANLARRLMQVEILTARVEGHTDSTASDEYNLQLSQARAQTVARSLTAGGMRLAPEHIVGRGEAMPIATNDTVEGRQENRRVVLIVSPD